MIKHETIMKVYMIEDKYEKTFKGVFALDVDFSTIVSLFEVILNISEIIVKNIVF